MYLQIVATSDDKELRTFKADDAGPTYLDDLLSHAAGCFPISLCVESSEKYAGGHVMVRISWHHLAHLLFGMLVVVPSG